MPHLFTLFAFFFVTFSLFGQYTGGEKFGKITDADRQLMVVPGDTAAEAYVLFDKLDLRFDFLPDKGPTLVETFHRRVKLLKPSSFERANISLSYDRSYQSLGGLDAQVHLPDGSTIKLRNADFVTQKGQDREETIKFTFPQIAPGAVIEYTYMLSTERIMAPSRYEFQENIPVRWAEYTALIPGYYNYVSLGTHGDFHIQDVKRRRLRWAPVALRAHSTVEDIDHMDMHYVMKDIPSFRPQPYTNNMRDYLPRVRLQLASIQYPNAILQPVLNDWGTVARELDQHQNLGRAYRQKGNFKQLWKAAEPLMLAAESPQARLAAAYYYVASHIRWNERYSWLGSDAPDNVFAAGTGNSADLNLCLLALLNEAGITAYPLLVSLRNGGAPIELYPLISQFDHLMVYAEIDGAGILLDANGVNRPPGLPREQALNHRGWVASLTHPRWIPIEVPRARRVMLCNMAIDDTGQADLDVTGRLESYYGHAGRVQLANMKGAEEGPIAADLIARHPEAVLVSQELLGGGENPAEPLTYKVQMKLPAGLASDEYLYVQPILLPLLDDELDDVEERIYPIDFPYPWREQYITTLTIPAGYAVEELPESVRLRSPDGGMVATYAAEKKADNTITVNFTVDMDRTVYQASDYLNLRALYRRIIDLQDASIVLKRAK